MGIDDGIDKERACLSNIDVALGIDGDARRSVELPLPVA